MLFLSTVYKTVEFLPMMGNIFKRAITGSEVLNGKLAVENPASSKLYYFTYSENVFFIKVLSVFYVDLQGLHA